MDCLLPELSTLNSRDLSTVLRDLCYLVIRGLEFDLDSGAHPWNKHLHLFSIVGSLFLVLLLVTVVSCLYYSVKLVLLVGFHVYSVT